MKSSGASYIGIGVAWAAVLFAVGRVMRGAPQATQVIMLIAGGVALTFVLLGGPRRTLETRKSYGIMPG